MKRLILFGDSHLAAMKKGLDNLAQRDAMPPGWKIDAMPLCRGGLLAAPFHRTDGETIRFEGCFIDRIPVGDQQVVYGFSGNAHTTRVVRDIDWSTHAPANIAEKEAPISSAMLRELFMADQRHMLDLLDAMKRLDLPVFVIEAPHLFRHNTIFTRARRAVLLEVDRLYRAFIAQELASRAIATVAVPPDCLDAEGLMLKEYRSPRPRDNHHANALFGERMIAEIIAHLERQG